MPWVLGAPLIEAAPYCCPMKKAFVPKMGSLRRAWLSPCSSGGSSACLSAEQGWERNEGLWYQRHLLPRGIIKGSVVQRRNHGQRSDQCSWVLLDGNENCPWRLPQGLSAPFRNSTLPRILCFILTLLMLISSLLADTKTFQLGSQLHVI